MFCAKWRKTKTRNAFLSSIKLNGFIEDEYKTADDAPAKKKYFLDVNHAMACCERQRAPMSIQPQYFRTECAEDLHKSRLRQTARER